MKLDKGKFLEIYRSCMGVLSTACKKYGCERKTIYNAIKADEEFRKDLEDIKEERLDFAESALLKRIKDDDTTAIIFYLKTQGRDRGYIERHDVAVESDEEIKGLCREFFAK